MKKKTRTSEAIPQELWFRWLDAVRRGSMGGLERLSAREPRLIDALGEAPPWTGRFRAIHYAAFHRRQNVVRWLLARGAAAGSIRGDGDWAPIHFALHSPATVRLLVAHGAVRDIFAAAGLGDATAVRRMLRANPRLVSRRGPDGATPLHFARSAAVARALLSAGANLRTRDTFHLGLPAEWVGGDRKILAVLKRAAPDDLHFAALRGDVRTVARILKRQPRAIDRTARTAKAVAGEPDETPLMVAIRHEQWRVVDTLLRRGASVTTQPSPLPEAVLSKNRRIVARLLDAGADPNAFGPAGNMSLHAATVHGDVPMLRLLLKHGARLDTRDRQHHATPLGWAEYHKHPRAVAFLRSRGARAT